MEQRLEAAAYSGDVTLLCQLLQEHVLLLHGEAPHVTPLHIAASLGHSEFVHEVLTVNSELAYSRNRQGLSAMHLAAKQGHFSVVKELLHACRDNAKELCSAKDNEGLMPFHTAAVHGRIDVLKELLDACPESAQARTAEGDSIFHLAAKSNSSETVQFLLDWNEAITTQLINSTNDKGNTILHVAVARKQLHTVKLLLGREGVHVNATNKRGCTALDVLIDSPGEHGDLVLGEQIRAAGGKTSAQLQGGQAQDIESSSTRRRPAFWSRWREYRRIKKSGHGTVDAKERYNELSNTLMLVATLIATITFQAGLNPPGGFKQKNEDALPSISPAGSRNHDYYYYYAYYRHNEEGEAVLSDDLSLFLLFDVIGLFASLSIILLLICCVPRKNRVVRGSLKWILWLSVFFTALAFSVAIKRIFYTQEYAPILIFYWFMLLSIFMAWVCFRAMRWLLRMGGCWKDKSESQAGPTKTVAIITKIAVGILLLLLVVVFGFMNFWFFFYVNWKSSEPRRH